jgi:hypothetical protein
MLTVLLSHNEWSRAGVLDPERKHLVRAIAGYIEGWLVDDGDVAHGSLDGVETIQDRWQRVGSWDLPTTPTVTTASDAGLSTRSATISGHALRKPGSIGS